jgi:hypothetical protein
MVYGQNIWEKVIPYTGICPWVYLQVFCSYVTLPEPGSPTKTFRRYGRKCILAHSPLCECIAVFLKRSDTQYERVVIQPNLGWSNYRC